MNLLKSILIALLRRPATTDTIVGALTKTVTKLEAHANKTASKAEADFKTAGALVDAAMQMKDEVTKARVIAANIGALLK